MMFERLNFATALSPGANLWVLPQKKAGTWPVILDWYLDFQIENTDYRKGSKLSEEMKKDLNNWELPVFDFSTKLNSDTLIGSNQLLPNNLTARVEYNGVTEEWIEKLCHVWNQLGRPSLRVFLPKGLSVEEFVNRWPKEARVPFGSIVSDMNSESF